MPSANTGKKIIKSIKIYKDHVTLSFINHETLKISNEAYLSSYLYEGKGLKESEINKLKEISSLSVLLNYALSLISKRHYSERKLKEKLLAKEDNYKIANDVISHLKQNDLIDDAAYLEDLLNWDNERCFGKNKIINHLKDEGIPDNLINKITFPYSKELKKAKILIPKLENKYSRYSDEIKKRHVYQALLTKGYDYEVAKEAVSLIKKSNVKEENNKLIADYQKIKAKFIKKYEGYQLKQKIYASLINKGYKSSMIKQVMEELDYENDF